MKFIKHSINIVGFVALAATVAVEAAPLEIGVMALSRDSAYADYDDEVSAVPLINWHGERFYWAIGQGGFNFINTETQRLSAIVETQPDYWESSDTNAFRNLDDRDRGFNAGALYSFKGEWGSVTAKVAADVTDTSNGAYADVNYAYPWKINPDLAFVASVGVNYIDSDYADYYYGISSDESAKSGIAEYSPGDSARVYASILMQYEFRAKWKLWVIAKATSLDDDLEDSPMVDDDVESLFGVGITYRFDM